MERFISGELKERPGSVNLMCNVLEAYSKFSLLPYLLRYQNAEFEAGLPDPLQIVRKPKIHFLDALKNPHKPVQKALGRKNVKVVTVLGRRPQKMAEFEAGLADLLKNRCGVFGMPRLGFRANRRSGFASFRQRQPTQLRTPSAHELPAD